MRGCALVVGHGRSGTNWLLEILNASRETFCRNEPDEIAGAPLSRLEHPWIRIERDARFAHAFDDAIRWTVTHIGERDPRASVSKHHLHELSRVLGLQGVFLRPRVRAALRKLIPTMRAGEWAIPAWLGAPKALERSFAVIKLTQTPGWACFALEHRPEIVVLHIVRHPGGFINSWRNRYLARRDPVDVRRANAARLYQVIDASPSWRERMGDIDAMSVMESELWYWCYACETIERSGRGKSSYRRIIYEEVSARPLEHARRLYETCGLLWDDRISNTIGATSGESARIATAWRERVSSDDVATIHRVLKGSLMESWWSGAFG